MTTFRTPKNVFAMLGNRAQFGAFDFVGDVAPLSGNIGPVFGSTVIFPGSKGTGADVMGKGSTYTNITTGVVYYNEGTAASPYWTPINLDHPGLQTWYSDFRDSVGIAVADTSASFTIPGSGLRVFGTAQPVADGGLTVAQGLGGAVASMFTGATSGVQIALGAGGTTVPFKPSTMGPLVIDALVTQLTAATLRRFFFGFIGTAADALVSPVTGTTVTLTNVQADLAGLMFDVGLTNSARLHATHNKANDTPTLLTTAEGVDTGINVIADSYIRLRIEVDTLGNARYFVQKTHRGTFLLALTPGTALAPVLAIHSTTAAAKTMLVKSFAAWGNKA